MNNREYTTLVENKQYPENPLVPLEEKFSDKRGYLRNLIHTPISSVAFIHTKKGQERSNHYHKTDFHYLYIISGEVEYWETDVENTQEIKKIKLKAGDLFFTPPMKLHKVIALTDCDMMSFAKNIKDPEHYEEDVVRKEF